MKTVKLTTCTNSIEAQLLQGFLANEGIESFTTNENFNSLYPNNIGVFGNEIQIFVLEKDIDQATEIMNSIQSPD